MNTTLFCFLSLAISSTAVDDLASRTPRVQAAIEEVDHGITKRLKELHIPGASVAIVKDGQILMMKGFGERDMEGRKPVTPDTLFAIGSCTKAFTAALLEMAQDEGKLSLDDAPRKYLPYFQMADPEMDGKIAISDLMSHRSGLMRTDFVWYPGTLNAEEVIRNVSVTKATNKIGGSFQYQNVMFSAAGQIAANVEGSNWQDLVETRIMRPLGMTASNTSVPQTLASPDHASGYQYNEDLKAWAVLPMRKLDNVAPAGAINSNARDMAKWLRFMLDGKTADGKRLVSQKGLADITSKHMTIAPKDSYGYGWMLEDWHGHNIVAHEGSIDGFHSTVALMPDQRLGLVILANASGSPLDPLAEEVLNHLVGTGEQHIAKKNATADHPEQEIGDYFLPLNKSIFTVSFKDGQLAVHPSGQPVIPLQSVGGRRYVALPPAPTNVFISFRPTKEDSKQTELVLEQSGMTLVMQKPKPYAAPITIDDLMAKVVAAQGGEQNLRKHHSLSVRYSTLLDNQGMTTAGVIYRAAPNLSSDFEVARAQGKTISWAHEFFDGNTGADEDSFELTVPLSASALDDRRVQDDFYGDLNWKTMYAKLEIVKLEKVGDEEAYALKKTLKSGTSTTDYISTKTSLILKTESANRTQSMSDYRNVDGVLIPFKIDADDLRLGKVHWTATDVQFDQPTPSGAFTSSPDRYARLVTLARMNQYLEDRPFAPILLRHHHHDHDHDHDHSH